MKILKDLVIENINNYDISFEIYYYGIYKSLAFDCSKMKTYIEYFHISKREVTENSDKWNNFAKNHLSISAKRDVEKFVNKLNKLLVFI